MPPQTRIGPRGRVIGTDKKVPAATITDDSRRAAQRAAVKQDKKRRTTMVSARATVQDMDRWIQQTKDSAAAEKAAEPELVVGRHPRAPRGPKIKVEYEGRPTAETVLASAGRGATAGASRAATHAAGPQRHAARTRRSR